jgi:hypothetical protein
MMRSLSNGVCKPSHTLAAVGPSILDGHVAPFQKVGASQTPAEGLHRTLSLPQRIAHEDAERTAALRDFDPAYDRYGSNSTELAEATRPFMSAVPR